MGFFISYFNSDSVLIVLIVLFLHFLEIHDSPEKGKSGEVVLEEQANFVEGDELVVGLPPHVAVVTEKDSNVDGGAEKGLSKYFVFSIFFFIGVFLGF